MIITKLKMKILEEKKTQTGENLYCFGLASTSSSSRFVIRARVQLRHEHTPKHQQTKGFFFITWHPHANIFLFRCCFLCMWAGFRQFSPYLLQHAKGHKYYSVPVYSGIIVIVHTLSIALLIFSCPFLYIFFVCLFVASLEIIFIFWVTQ